MSKKDHLSFSPLTLIHSEEVLYAETTVFTNIYGTNWCFTLQIVSVILVQLSRIVDWLTVDNWSAMAEETRALRKPVPLSVPELKVSSLRKRSVLQ